MTPKTLLHRQVHPSWVQKGRITSQVFRPTPKDGKKLSVYNGDLIDASGAWEHFTEILGFSSTGGIAVTVAECDEVGLSAREEPLPSFPQHATIDFSGLSKGQKKKTGERLKAAAEKRGWLYQPD